MIRGLHSRFLRDVWKKTSDEPHAAARVVVVVHVLFRKLFAYEWLIRVWRSRDRESAAWSAAFAPVYVFVLWLPLLVAFFATQTAAPGHGLWRLVVGLAAYRMADIANFYVGLFFDRRQNLLAGPGAEPSLPLSGGVAMLVGAIGVKFRVGDHVGPHRVD